MVDVKEIKSVELAPFTLMSSSIHAILAFIGAILMLIALGAVAAVIPQFQVIASVITLTGVALIVIAPIASFFIFLAASFFVALVYNLLVPRLGGIKLGLEGNQVTEIPIVPFALILAGVQAVGAFIFGLFSAAAIAPIIAAISGSIPVVSQAIANATNATNATIPTGQAVAAGGAFLAVILIIAVPILVFIFGFIGNALTAIFYNYIATRVAKIQLDFAAVAGSLYELKSVPVVPAALAVAVVATVWGFLQGLWNLVTLAANGSAAAGVGSLIGSIIGSFIEAFIITALIAIFYNFLAPRIGAIKLDLE
jgi:hypothetical protein